MNGTDYLDQTRPAPNPVNLMGLSPAEIQGVSAGRARTDQKMFQMLGLMMDKKKMESTLETQAASRRLSERKLQKLDEPAPTTELTIGGKAYNIPKASIVEGLRLMNQVDRNAKLNLLTQEQIDEMNTKIPLKAKNAQGVEQTYELSQTHFKSIAEAMKMQKREKERSQALIDLKDVAPADMMKKENFSNLLIANPSAAAALMNKVTPEGSTGLSDAQYRYYADTNVSMIQAILKKSNPDDTLINTVNNLSRKLKDPHMLLKIKAPTLFHPIDGTRAVTVSLPPGITADRIYADAEELGVDVSDILRGIYEASQKKE